MSFGRALSRAVITTSLMAVLVRAQPEFDVATVKLSPPPKGATININLGTAVNGKVDLTNASLSDCIKFAYGIVADAQLAGPDWIKDLRFDVLAKAPPDTPRDQLLLMLQALLDDRLKLALHKEPRQLPFLALVPGKSGPRLQPSKPDAVGPQVPGRIVSPRMSMAVLVMLLSRFERQTVLDMTGLKGSFEVRLEWT